MMDVCDNVVCQEIYDTDMLEIVDFSCHAPKCGWMVRNSVKFERNCYVYAKCAYDVCAIDAATLRSTTLRSTTLRTWITCIHCKYVLQAAWSQVVWMTTRRVRSDGRHLLTMSTYTYSIWYGTQHMSCVSYVTVLIIQNTYTMVSETKIPFSFSHLITKYTIAAVHRQFVNTYINLENNNRY
jgi:hypothetical protein